MQTVTSVDLQLEAMNDEHHSIIHIQLLTQEYLDI